MSVCAKFQLSSWCRSDSKVLFWTGGWPGWWVALEEWKLRLTSAKVEVEVEAELGNIFKTLCSNLLFDQSVYMKKMPK